ncbi:hypothetical protein Tco_0286579 [Tanacetum coccineum]
MESEIGQRNWSNNQESTLWLRIGLTSLNFEQQRKVGRLRASIITEASLPRRFPEPEVEAVLAVTKFESIQSNLPYGIAKLFPLIEIVLTFVMRNSELEENQDFEY